MHIIYYLSQNITDDEIWYIHIEKLALAIVHEVQWLRHYILLPQNMVVAYINPFHFVLTRWMIGRKYNKWIVILQEFDLEFVSTKSKKSLVFAEFMLDLPSLDEDKIHEESFVDECIVES